MAYTPKPIGGGDELTASNMLREYRLHSPPHIEEQAKSFRSLSVPERAELLFYSYAHMTMLMQMLHARIAPEEAKTQTFEKTTTQ